MSRLPMLTRDDIAAEDHDVFGAGMNLHRQTLHSPQLARHSRRLGLYFRRESRLPGRICELAILRVARLARSAYEYSHHLKIALEAATAIFHGGAGEDTVERLKALLAPDQVVDLLFVASFYAGFVRFTASLALEVEPEFAPFLERFPLPT
jgi:alkylhydroperoxidase family enzyme